MLVVRAGRDIDRRGMRERDAGYSIRFSHVYREVQGRCQAAATRLTVLGGRADFDLTQPSQILRGPNNRTRTSEIGGRDVLKQRQSDQVDRTSYINRETDVSSMALPTDVSLQCY